MRRVSLSRRVSALTSSSADCSFSRALSRSKQAFATRRIRSCFATSSFCFADASNSVARRMSYRYGTLNSACVTCAAPYAALLVPLTSTPNRFACVP